MKSEVLAKWTGYERPRRMWRLKMPSMDPADDEPHEPQRDDGEALGRDAQSLQTKTSRMMGVTTDMALAQSVPVVRLRRIKQSPQDGVEQLWLSVCKGKGSTSTRQAALAHLGRTSQCYTYADSCMAAAGASFMAAMT
eukprot:6212780-Pleurochrysis_carterae.AAC.5